MPSNDALDLAAIDPPVWRVMVNDVVYGPYTMGQMQAFCEEGRLHERSKVADGDGGAFLNAFEHKALRDLFGAPDDQAADDPAPAPTNYLISVHTDADGRRATIAVLNQIGRFSELMPGTFVLNANITVVALRSQLSTVLAERGRFVIVNAASGQLAWMGLGADADAHAKSIWKRGD